MKEWLEETEESLLKAIDESKKENMPEQDLYKIAPVIFFEKHNLEDESLFNEMCDANEAQVLEDWSHDEKSKKQFKFHYVSSYLYCYVVASKIDEFKYDKIMEYVTGKMELFTDDYGI